MEVERAEVAMAVVVRAVVVRAEEGMVAEVMARAA